MKSLLVDKDSLMTIGGLFFNVFFLAVYALLPLVFQCLDYIV